MSGSFEEHRMLGGCREIAIESSNIKAEMDNEEKRAIESIKENFSCAICLSLTEEPCMPPCGHLFCSFCLMQWIQSLDEANCPKCRRGFKTEAIVQISNGFSAKQKMHDLNARKKILKPGFISQSMRFGNIIVYQEESQKPTFKSILLSTVLFILVVTCFRKILELL